MRKYLDPKAEKVVGLVRHKYLLPLDAEMRAKITPHASTASQPTSLPPIESAAARPIGNIPPAEAEANYYATLEEPRMAA